VLILSPAGRASASFFENVEKGMDFGMAVFEAFMGLAAAGPETGTKIAMAEA
jgi:hypothetical protein